MDKSDAHSNAMLATLNSRRKTKCSLLPSPSLAGCNLGSRDSVAVEVVVDVGSVARVGRLDVSRNLGCGRESLGTAASNLELSARDVELRWGAGVVDGELLDAEQVLASSDARGNCDGVVVYKKLVVLRVRASLI